MWISLAPDYPMTMFGRKNKMQELHVIQEENGKRHIKTRAVLNGMSKTQQEIQEWACGF